MMSLPTNDTADKKRVSQTYGAALISDQLDAFLQERIENIDSELKSSELFQRGNQTRAYFDESIFVNGDILRNRGAITVNNRADKFLVEEVHGLHSVSACSNTSVVLNPKALCEGYNVHTLIPSHRKVLLVHGFQQLRVDNGLSYIGQGDDGDGRIHEDGLSIEDSYSDCSMTSDSSCGSDTSEVENGHMSSKIPHSVEIKMVDIVLFERRRIDVTADTAIVYDVNPNFTEMEMAIILKYYSMTAFAHRNGVLSSKRLRRMKLNGDFSRNNHHMYDIRITQKLHALVKEFFPLTRDMRGTSKSWFNLQQDPSFVQSQTNEVHCSDVSIFQPRLDFYGPTISLY